ncbi:FliH/SctL family protein [Desulfovibrio oxyclinae]|uniref:FliH/SctL family protein n=1 Tax=Desulfovibrio oxyclinae TaxID=63560 RepID=UPI000371B421|nr:FliH/SctL family protein [Desulfovibrio oxyclinae]
MSSSSADEPVRTRNSGRVIMGMDTPGPNEMSLQELEGKKRLMWDESIDEEYTARVRARAQAMAKDILAKAMQEAEQLKASAHEEGYNEGLAQAQQQLDQHVSSIGQTFQATVESLNSQGRNLWSDRRDDILKLVKAAVAKTIQVELSEQRVESLTALLEEALSKLEEQRELTIRCAPQDQELLDELMRQAKERNPGIGHWQLRPDPALENGGVVVETAQGRVDNTVDSRWAAVEPILEQMTLTQTSQDESPEK